MENIVFLIICYVIAHVVVTLIGMLHTIFNIYILKMKPMDEHSLGEGYEKTKPFHPIYNIIIFPIFAYIYLNGQNQIQLLDVVFISLVWGTITLIIDFIGWVIVKHPWSLTVRQFYIEYQPWITLVYVGIYASPFVAWFVITI